MPLGDPMGGEAPEQERGKLLRIAQLRVPVSDIEQAIELYSEVLGLRLASDMRAMGQAEIALDEGATLLLYVPGKDDEDQPGIRTGAVLATDSIYDFHKVLVDEGIEFTMKTQRDKFGRLIARFVDDDGNEFEVVDAPK
jgi:catechol 2,3-dioxygenase-like lactoylglutathione lyase family enzyme